MAKLVKIVESSKFQYNFGKTIFFSLKVWFFLKMVINSIFYLVNWFLRIFHIVLVSFNDVSQRLHWSHLIT